PEVAVGAPRALDDRAAPLAEEIRRRALVADRHDRGAVTEGEVQVERARFPSKRTGEDHATEAVGLAGDRGGAELGGRDEVNGGLRDARVDHVREREGDDGAANDELRSHDGALIVAGSGVPDWGGVAVARRGAPAQRRVAARRRALG